MHLIIASLDRKRLGFCVPQKYSKYPKWKIWMHASKNQYQRLIIYWNKINFGKESKEILYFPLCLFELISEAPHRICLCNVSPINHEYRMCKCRPKHHFWHEETQGIYTLEYDQRQSFLIFFQFYPRRLNM